MFYQNKNWVDAIEYDLLVDKYNRLEESLRELRNFYNLCLYVTGDKNKIEAQAYSLYDKHGLLGALRLQRTTTAVQNYET